MKEKIEVMLGITFVITPLVFTILINNPLMVVLSLVGCVFYFRQLRKEKMLQVK